MKKVLIVGDPDIGKKVLDQLRTDDLEVNVISEDEINNRSLTAFLPSKPFIIKNTRLIEDPVDMHKTPNNRKARRSKIKKKRYKA